MPFTLKLSYNQNWDGDFLMWQKSTNKYRSRGQIRPPNSRFAHPSWLSVKDGRSGRWLGKNGWANLENYMDKSCKSCNFSKTRHIWDKFMKQIRSLSQETITPVQSLFHINFNLRSYDVLKRAQLFNKVLSGL